MKMKKVALLLSFLICISLPSIAQVVFFTAQDTIDLNQSTYTTAVKVRDFKQVTGAQFSINWDSTVLDFDKVGDFALNFSENDNFSSDARGALRFIWFDPATTGVDLPDSTTLFSIDFNLLGAGNRQSRVAFTDTPIVREVYDTSFTVINSQFIDGALLLTSGTVSSTRENPAALNLQSISPNPIRTENPKLNFFTKKADTLTFRVVTMNGQEIFRSSEQALAGRHTKQLDRSIFPNSGTYLVIVQSADFISTQKLMVQD
ncbi:MAG: hypothetical protein Sapg2KO_45810 [Saprospiraceae bacterium]